MIDAPTLAGIEAAAARLRGRIVATPVVALASDRFVPFLPAGARAVMKLELFQQAGSFKARGALLNVDALGPEARRRGVTTVSAGNHALALAWAAAKERVPAKVVMPANADPVRVAGCRALGAEVILAADVGAAFAEADRIAAAEGMTLVHPFEGGLTVLGTATCGLELARAAPELEAVIVQVGGGGLIAGVARAVKLANPGCAVYGVEPFGADSMWRSFEAGAPVRLAGVSTIATSLAAPMALPMTFALTRAHVEEIVRVTDDELRAACALLWDGLKLGGEPATGAGLAALIGPLRERLAGKRVGLIASGSNTGEDAVAKNVAEGRRLLAG